MVEQLGEIVDQYAKVAVVTTSGDFENEELAVKELDRIILQSKLFRLYREVSGRYVNGRPNVEETQPRIDRILIPSQEVISAGWRHGPIAIECKRSGAKLGKLISQALDYSNAVFEITPGFHIWCEWLFVYPLESPKGDVESIMAQNRIGWLSPFLPNSELTFGCGGTNAINLTSDGSVKCKSLNCGRKRGSR